MLVLLLSACGLLGGPAPLEPLAVGPTPQRVTSSVLAPVLGTSRDPVPKASLTRDQCGQLRSGGALLDDCVTSEITCGETIIGHTIGGIRRFDTAFYRNNFCTPDTTNHDGGNERVYRLRLPPGDRRAVVTLDTPCADLDLAAMLWNGEDCPTAGSSVPRCEMWPKDGTAREQVELVSQRESTWLIVVEGKNTQEGAFGLSVQCFDGLY